MKIEFDSVSEFIDFINQFGFYQEPALNEKPKEEVEDIVVKIDAKPKEVEKLLIRRYSATQKQRFPKIIKMNNDGTFQIANAKRNNGIAVWTIKEILILQKRIPQTNEYRSWEQMGEGLNISKFTVQYLCYGIEKGYFDKYIKEWEQLQANNFYSNVKSWNVENNPQKRKEQGMI